MAPSYRRTYLCELHALEINLIGNEPILIDWCCRIDRVANEQDWVLRLAAEWSWSLSGQILSSLKHGIIKHTREVAAAGDIPSRT